MSSKSLTLSTLLELPQNFLQADPKTYEEMQSFQSAREYITKLTVVNDVAERGVQLISEFNNILTHDEEHHKLELVLSLEDTNHPQPCFSACGFQDWEPGAREGRSNHPFRDLYNLVGLQLQRLVEVCSPKTVTANKASASAKYTPHISHIRHYLEVFFWPKFRCLRYIPSENRKTVRKNLKKF